MSIVFRASDEPAVSREESWRHVLGETVGALETRGIPDRFVAGEIGALRIGDLSSREDGGARRTSAHMRSSDPDVCKIDVLASGQCVVEQGGREALLRPGDFTLVDMARPATWSTWGSARLIAVVFPAALLPLGRNHLARLTGDQIAGSEGPGAIVSSIARQLPAQLDVCGAGDGARLGTAVADMLTATLAARLDRRRQMPAESRRRALLLQVHAFIEERLGDPELSPGTVAAATTSRCAICTGCSRRKREPSGTGFARAGSSAAGVTCSSRRCARCRSARSAPAGGSPIRRTSAACSRRPTGCRPASSGLRSRTHSGRWRTPPRCSRRGRVGAVVRPGGRPRARPARHCRWRPPRASRRETRQILRREGRQISLFAAVFSPYRPV